VGALLTASAISQRPVDPGVVPSWDAIPKGRVRNPRRRVRRILEWVATGTCGACTTDHVEHRHERREAPLSGGASSRNSTSKVSGWSFSGDS
jgi:hypothetical protein